MKRLVLAFAFSLGLASFAISGCGYEATGSVNQIRLAIYKADCVDVLDASMSSGAKLQIYPCSAGKLSQQWLAQPVNNGQNYMFVNANSQMCMAVASDPNTAPGQFVVQYPCVSDGSQPDQIWSIKQAPSGEAGVQLVSMASGQCLDLPYGAVASIFTLQQYTCDSDDPAQGWNVNQVARGNTP